MDTKEWTPGAPSEPGYYWLAERLINKRVYISLVMFDDGYIHYHGTGDSTQIEAFTEEWSAHIRVDIERPECPKWLII